MDNIPLTDASFSEVLARVSYRLIERALRHPYYDDWTNAAALRHLSERLARAGWRALSFWVSAYNYAYSQGEILPLIRTHFMFRARMGYMFRDVAYMGYKRGRYSDPPVSNTGVTLSANGKRGTAQ